MYIHVGKSRDRFDIAFIFWTDFLKNLKQACVCTYTLKKKGTTFIYFWNQILNFLGTKK